MGGDIQEDRKRAGILGRVVAGWIEWVRRSALWVLITATLITGGLLYYTANNLGISTDTADMLSETLHFRRINEDYKKAFPQSGNALLIVIDGDTADLALDGAMRIAERLRRDTDLFKTVTFPGGDRFFQEHALLYLGIDELENLADHLAKVQPFLGKLARDQTLKGLFSMLRHALEAAMEGEEVDLGPLFEGIGTAAESALKKVPYTLSWLRLMWGGELREEDHRQFILVRPRLDFHRMLPGERAVKAVRRLIQEYGPDQGIRVRITGKVALEYEELRSVSQGAGIAGILALILVGVVLFVGLGSPKLVFSTLITLVMGLVWTGGFATAAVGHLNLISVAFAVLYIGLGVDYAIHFCLRYRELVAQDRDHATALVLTGQEIGPSLALCALTTAIGFYAFIPTVFRGVAELGLISGTGMFIGLIANLTVLPALLTLMPLSKGAFSGSTSRLKGFESFLTLPYRRSGVIRVTALTLGVGALILMPHVTFDRNTLNLRDPNSESVITFNELLSKGSHSPWSLNVLAPNEEAARDYTERLERLNSVKRVITLNHFIPKGQEEKLALIDQMALILGEEISGSGDRKANPSHQDQIKAMEDFLAVLKRYLEKGFGAPMAEEAHRLYDLLGRFLSVLKAQKEGPQKEMLDDLEKRIMGSLPGRLQTLRRALSTDRVTKESLPGELVKRWVSEGGRYRVEVFPQEDLNDEGALRRFVATVQDVAPDAIGFPVIMLEAGDAVVSAFRQAFLSALVAIALLLLLLLRPKKDLFLVMMPLLLAGALTGAASVLLNIPFNFANVIALPLILGVGVDNGIHMVKRIRKTPAKEGQILQTSTARAVLFSALTTICSFGNLAFSPHRGMASMGQLLSIGIGLALVCTLIVLPALTRHEY